MRTRPRREIGGAQPGLDLRPRAETPAAAPARRSVGVARFVHQLKAGLSELFPSRFWLEGEVSGYKVVRNGHAFFALKEGTEQVEAVLWARDRTRLNFTPEDGSQVLARVRKVDFYGPSGRLRLQVEDLEPHGIGALAKALEERRVRLEAEGLFAQERKRPIPALPRVIGIATAPRSAALKDILEILQQRFAERRMMVRPCRVQGKGAAEDIAAALDDLNRDGTSDVIILGRGGGSMEDLWCFNEEVVVRAIARSRIPVVAGIGHEIDSTLADFVADLRVATPTAAAQRCVPERRAVEEHLRASGERLENALGARLESARDRLRYADAVLADPRRLVTEHRLRLEGLRGRAREVLGALTPERRRRLEGCATRARRALEALTPGRRSTLERTAARMRVASPDVLTRRHAVSGNADRLLVAMTSAIEQAKADLGRRASQIDALSPLAVLGRGFAVARTADGVIVRDASGLAPGDALRLRFARGAARAEVIDVDEDPEAERPPDAPDEETS